MKNKNPDADSSPLMAQLEEINKALDTSSRDVG